MKKLNTILLIISLALFGSYAQARTGDPMYQPYGEEDVTRHGIRAADAGTTTTVTAWVDSTHVTVGSTSHLRVGDNISIERAALDEGTVDIAGDTSITNLADTDAGTDNFANGSKVFIAGGAQAERLQRNIQFLVMGDTGNIYYAKFNDILSSYEQVGGDDDIDDISEGLCTAINNSHSSAGTIIACNDGSTYEQCLAQEIDNGADDRCGDNDGDGTINIKVYATTAGTGYTWENIYPSGRGWLSYSTTQPNVPEHHWFATMNCTGSCYEGGDDTFGEAVTATANGVAIFKPNYLLTTITAISGNTLTIADAATNIEMTGQTVYLNAQVAFEATRDALGTGEGGTITIPEGTYYFCGNSTNGHAAAFDSKEVSLRGAGSGRTIIAKPAYRSAELIHITAVTGLRDDIIFEGITFEGNNAYPDFNITSSSGLFVATSSETDYTDNLTIKDCEFKNFDKYGLGVGNVRDFTFVGNYLYRCMTGLILNMYDAGARGTIKSSRIKIENNTVEQMNHIGLNIYGFGAGQVYTTGAFEDLHVTGNDLIDCNGAGLELYASTEGAYIIGNTGRNNGYNGVFGDANTLGFIVIKYASDVVVVGNQAEDCHTGTTMFGIADDYANSIFTSSGLNISNNVFNNINSIGVSISGGVQDTIIAKNIMNGGNAGVIVGGGLVNETLRGISISGNQIKRNRRGIVAYISVGQANSVTTDIDIIGNKITDPNISGEAPDYSNGIGSAITVYGFDAEHKITNVLIQDNKITEHRVAGQVGDWAISLPDFIDGITLIQNRSSGMDHDDVTCGGLGAQCVGDTGAITSFAQYDNEWQGFGATPETVYIEEGDAAKADSSGAGLYIDFNATDFAVGVVGNECNITIDPDDITISSSSPYVKMTDSDADGGVNDYGLFSYDGASSHVYAVEQAGDAYINLTPVLTDGTSAGYIRAFKNTNTSGSRYFQLFGNDADTAYTLLYTDTNGDLQINSTGNNINTNNDNLTVGGTLAVTGAITEAGNAVYNSTEVPGGELGGTWASPTVDSGIHDDEYVEVEDNFVGDVTGPYSATVVGDNSHNHSTLTSTVTVSGLNQGYFFSNGYGFVRADDALYLDFDDSDGTNYLYIRGKTTGTYRNEAIIRDTGEVFFPYVYSDTVGGTNIDLYIDSAGQIGAAPSSRRFKTNIQSLGNVDWIYLLEPVTFNWKESGLPGCGLIAEDVETIAPQLVGYDENGEVSSVQYSRLIPYLLKEIQNLNKRITELGGAVR